MKKLIGVIIVAAGAYLALTYYGGYAGEKALKQQMEQVAVQGEMHGYQVDLQNYERGLLSSDTVMALRVDLSHLGMDELTVTSTTEIQHGPVLFTSRGVKLGLFAGQSQLELSSSNHELAPWLSELFASSLNDILMIGHFTQTYTGYVTVPTLEQTIDGGVVKLDGAELVVKGSYDGREAQGQLALGALNVNDGSSATFMLSPSVLDFDVRMLEDLVNYEGQVNYAADSLTVSVVGAPEVVLADMGLAITQELVNERMDTNVAFTIGEVQGSPIATRNLIYQVGVKQVAPAAVVAWQTLARDIQNPAGEFDFSAHQDELMAVLELLLHEDLALSVHVGADILDGEANAHLTANYVGLADNRALSDVVDAMEYFAIVDAELEVKLSESVVMQTPLYFMLAGVLDTYFDQEGEHLIMRASLKGGQLNVADQLFPLEFLLGD